MTNKFNFEHHPITEAEEHLVYTNTDDPANCIGHLRGYLDNHGCMPTTWFDHHGDLKTPWFHEEFNALVEWLRKSVLKNRVTLCNFCYTFGDSLPLDDSFQSVAIKVLTDRFSYYIRLCQCFGDYNVYIYCYTNTVESYGDGIEIVKVAPRKPWQSPWRVYTNGIHEATLDTLEEAREYARDLLDIQNDDTIKEEEETA